MHGARRDARFTLKMRRRRQGYWALNVFRLLVPDLALHLQHALYKSGFKVLPFVAYQVNVNLLLLAVDLVHNLISFLNNQVTEIGHAQL